MSKNYYEWLEVNKNASNEIIDKAYKTLAKKYHPDLQDSEKKIQYEETLKHINEAYEVLSNKEKRKIYDDELEENTFKEEDFKLLYEENQHLKNIIENLKNEIQNNKSNTNYYYTSPNFVNNSKNDFYKEDYNKKVNDAVNKAYYDAYIQDLKARGYKIKYKKTWKDYFKFLISIFLTILILFALFQIPFIKNYFNDFYENNQAIKAIVDIFNFSK